MADAKSRAPSGAPLALPPSGAESLGAERSSALPGGARRARRVSGPFTTLAGAPPREARWPSLARDHGSRAATTGSGR